MATKVFVRIWHTLPLLEHVSLSILHNHFLSWQSAHSRVATPFSFLYQGTKSPYPTLPMPCLLHPSISYSICTWYRIFHQTPLSPQSTPFTSIFIRYFPISYFEIASYINQISSNLQERTLTSLPRATYNRISRVPG